MKNILVIITIALTLFSCGNKRTTLSGRVLNTGNHTYVYLYEIDYSQPTKEISHRSSISEKGEYFFEVNSSQDKYYLLTLDTSEWSAFKTNELDKLFSSKFNFDNCNKIYYVDCAFLYLKSNSEIELDVDFEKIENTCSLGVGLKFGKQNIFEKTFYEEFYELNSSSELYDKLTDAKKGVRPKPRHMKVKEADSIFTDNLNEIAERLEYVKSIDSDLHKLFECLSINKSKSLMRQYYHFTYRERVLDFYKNGKKFPEYEKLFQFGNMAEVGVNRENFQNITSYIVFLRNQELKKFESFYPWSDDMKSLVKTNFDNILGEKYINAWDSYNKKN